MTERASPPASFITMSGPPIGPEEARWRLADAYRLIREISARLDREGAESSFAPNTPATDAGDAGRRAERTHGAAMTTL